MASGGGTPLHSPDPIPDAVASGADAQEPEYDECLDPLNYEIKGHKLIWEQVKDLEDELYEKGVALNKMTAQLNEKDDLIRLLKEKLLNIAQYGYGDGGDRHSGAFPITRKPGAETKANKKAGKHYNYLDGMWYNSPLTIDSITTAMLTDYMAPFKYKEIDGKKVWVDGPDGCFKLLESMKLIP